MFLFFYFYSRNANFEYLQISCCAVSIQLLVWNECELLYIYTVFKVLITLM